jgi:UDP-N-acetylglucosamine 2-epimerase (non-hydrolysing)
VKVADLLVVLGTRAGAVSAASVVDAGARRGLSWLVVASGPYCRLERSRSFDVELGLNGADVAAAEHDAALGAEIVSRFELELARSDPRMVVSVGDDGVAARCAEAAARRYPVARLEGGLRSGQRQDRDEVNRTRCDHVSRFLYAPGDIETANLRSEAVRPERIVRVGSTVCATAAGRRAAAGRRDGVDGPYCVVTVSRPETIDDYEPLRRVVEAVLMLSRCAPVIFPMEEHTRQRLADHGLAGVIEGEPGVQACRALGYGDFGDLLTGARLVLTDSGVVQEDATGRGVSCLTLRDATERRLTLTEGTNRLVGTDTELIVEEALAVLEGNPRPRPLPNLWDGLAGDRIAASLCAHLEQPATLTGTRTES